MVISRKKKILMIFLSIVAFLMVFAAWYQYTYSMDEAASFEVNSPDYSRKLVIVTQGSEFKDNLTKNVINSFKQDSVFIKVIDVSLLKEIAPENYTAILLIHTWENWKPPIEIKEFLDSSKSIQDKIVVVTTSGEGTSKMEGIDAITGESNPENIKPITDQAIAKLKSLLQQ